MHRKNEFGLLLWLIISQLFLWRGFGRYRQEGERRITGIYSFITWKLFCRCCYAAWETAMKEKWKHRCTASYNGFEVKWNFPLWLTDKGRPTRLFLAFSGCRLFQEIPRAVLSRVNSRILPSISKAAISSIFIDLPWTISRGIPSTNWMSMLNVAWKSPECMNMYVTYRQTSRRRSGL